jgi:hypothetical protein
MQAAYRVTRALVVQALVNLRTPIFYLNYARPKPLDHFLVYREFDENLTLFLRNKTRARLQGVGSGRPGH